MIASFRSDRKVKPDTFEFTQLSAGEITSGARLYYQDRAGRMANIRITTVKTWKRKPTIEVHCKFGLYEFFTETYQNASEPTNFYKLN